MDREKLLDRMIVKVYKVVCEMIKDTSGDFEERVKDERLVMASYAAALYLGMLAVLTYGRKIRGQFKDLRSHFTFMNKKEAVRAASEDACTIMSGYLSKIDPDYEYEIRILKKDKKVK